MSGNCNDEGTLGLSLANDVVEINRLMLICLCIFYNFAKRRNIVLLL